MSDLADAVAIIDHWMAGAPVDVRIAWILVRGDRMARRPTTQTFERATPERVFRKPIPREEPDE